MLARIAVSDGVTTSGRWFGTSDHTSFGWLSSATRSRRRGVVIVPPFGYEYWTSHRSLRVLAESLAVSGISALRLDLWGMGDAVGDLWDAQDVLALWKRDIANAVDELRRQGTESVSLVGLRFGATLAIDAAEGLGVDRVVGWVPVSDGRRYARELAMLSTPVPAEVRSYGGDQARALAGTVITDALLADIAGMSLKSVGRPADNVFILDRDDRPNSGVLVDRLRDMMIDVRHTNAPGAASMLDVPTEVAGVPSLHIEALVEYLASAGESAASTRSSVFERPGADAHVHGKNGVEVREEVRAFGPRGLIGLQTSPAGGPETGVTLLFLNTGSESHVGSGRVWVELSRSLAAAGSTAVRLDFRGWGESPDDGHAPGRPYDQHTIEDVRDAVQALRQSGHRRIVAVGSCAGAWVGLREVSTLRLDAFVALNPQLYWQPGDPVEALMADTRSRRLAEIAEIKDVASTGEWARIDAVTPPCSQARWLDELGAAPFPVILAFSPGDDGLEYLQDRFSHRLAAMSAVEGSSLSVVEMSRLDHPMHQHWNRGEASLLVERVVASVMEKLPTTEPAADVPVPVVVLDAVAPVDDRTAVLA